MTAQDGYRTLLHDRVSPALRGLGLRGSTGRYALPHPDDWALLAFQKHRSGSRDEVLFTVNLLVVPRDAWTAHRAATPGLPGTPQAGLQTGGPEWQERIGFLLPARLDHWWTLRTGEDAGPVGDAVVAALTDYAVPALRDRLSGSCR